MKPYALVLASGVAVLAPPTPARALCPDNVVSGALSARIRGDQIQTLVTAAIEQVPETVGVPEEPFVLFGCSILGDTVVTPRNGVVRLDLTESEVWLESGRIGLAARFSIDVSTDLDLELCGLGAGCSADLIGEEVSVNALIRLDINQCEPDVGFDRLELNLTSRNLDLDVDECGLATEVINALYSWFETSILGYVTDQLDEILRDLAPSVVDDIIESIATEGIEASGVAIRVSPETMRVTPDEIAFTLGAALDGVSPPRRCAPGGRSFLPTSVPMPPFPDSQGGTGFALSRNFVDYLIDVAWRQGWLCIDTRDYDIDFGAVLEELAPGVDIVAQVTAPIRPSIDFDSFATGSEIRLELPSVRVEISIRLPNASPSTIIAETRASAVAALELDPVDQSIQITPKDLTIGRVDINTASGPLSLNEAGLRGTIETVLLPLFEEELSPLTLSGGVFSIAGVVISLEEIISNDEILALTLDVFGASPYDRTAPQTVLGSAMPPLVASDVEIRMESVDDFPPERHVYHWVTVDGIRETEPRSSRIIQLSDLPPGPHSVEVAAEDIAGNLDPTPELILLNVDSAPPTITILDKPLGVARDEIPSIEFEVADDKASTTTLRVDFEVGEVLTANGPDRVVTRGSLEPRGRLDLPGLEEDRNYRVTLTAIDTVGNETTEQIAFAVDRDPTLDCTGTGRGSLWVALLALAALAGRRRRFALLLLVMLAASPARAITTGGAFAGPTAESGSSVYWNAAALGQKRNSGVRFFFEGGGSIIDIDYTRAPADPTSTENFETVNFAVFSPSAQFLLQAPTPVKWLDVLVGGFSPTTSGAGWPDDGPQRFFATDATIAAYAVPVGVLMTPDSQWSFSLMVGPNWGFINTYNSFDYGAFANDQLPPGADPFPVESELLEGVNNLRANGFGLTATAGVYWRPTSRLRVGLGGVYNTAIDMNGTIDLELPDSVEESTGIALEPSGDIAIDYRMPWSVNAELEYQIGAHKLATTFDFQRKTRQQASPALVTNGDPTFVDGPRLSVSGRLDDWTIGVRDFWRIDEAWELAGRVDHDPRSIPDETLNPVSMDFTTVEVAVGARHRLNDSLTLSLTYAFRYMEPVVVSNSLFNPRQAGDSGLNLPSANGTYAPDPVHRFILGVQWGS